MLSSNLNPTQIFYCFLPMNHSSGAWISISQSKTGIFTPSGTSHTFGTLQRLNNLLIAESVLETENLGG